jgi:hypothetical protein
MYYIVTHPGFSWIIRRVLDLMIEFIGPWRNWLQQFINHYLTHSHLLPTGHSTETILISNWTELNCQFKVKVTLRLTVSQEVLVSSPIWGSWPDISYFWQLRSFLWGALSDERKGLSFVYAAGPRQHSLSRVGASWDIFYFLRFETSLFVASYDSQGDGGGIRPRLHPGVNCKFKSQSQSYASVSSGSVQKIMP